MAEVKNSFLASKMNKDLDDRLIPSNEYKDALNIAVSNSEDSDVGALENILQNTNIYPISEEGNVGDNDGKIIGHIVNPNNDDIYLFYTNYIDTSSDGLSNHQSSSFGANTSSVIIRYNPDLPAGLSSQLLIGRFLNFSENSPIHGINIVEDFLFWTDDRNQPRKINIKRASADRFHYTNEDDISVAKYAPYKPMDLYKSYNGTYKTTMKDVSSANLPDGTTPNPDYNAGYAGDKNFLEDKFVRFSYRFKYEDGEYSIIAPFTQIAFIPKQDGSFLDGDEDKAFKSTVVSFMENKVDQISLVINLPEIGNNLRQSYKLKEIDILYKESNELAISVLDTIEINEIELEAGATSVYEYSYQSRKPVKVLPQNQSTRVYDKTPVRALAQEVSGNRVIYGNFINKHTAPNHLNYQVSVTQKFATGSDGNYSYIEYPEHTLKRNRNYQVGFVLSDRYGRQSDVILSNVVNNNTADGVFGASTLYFPYRENATSPTTFLADVGNSIKIQLNEQIQSDRSPLTDSNLSSTGQPGLYNLSTNPTGWYSYKVVVKQNQQEYYNVYLPGFLKGDLNSGPNTATHSVLISDNINKVPRDLQEVGPLQTKYSSGEVLFPIVENVVPSSAGANHNKAFFPGDKKYEVTTIASFSDLNDLGSSSAVASLFESDEDPLVMRIGDNKGGLGGIRSHMLPTLSIAETTPFVSNIEIYYETSTSGLISDLNASVIENIGTPVAGFNIFDYTHKENQNFQGSSTATGAAESPYVTSDMLPVNNLNASITTTIDSSATTNGSFTSTSTITVQNVVNVIFVGQTLNIEGIPSGAKVVNVNSLTITLDNPVTILTSGTAVQFSDTSLSVVDNLQTDRSSEFELVSGGATGSYRIKIKDNFYYGPDASAKESYVFTISLRNSANNASATTNGSFNDVSTITVQNVVNTIFAGQTLNIAGTPSGAKVSSINGLVVTLDKSVDIQNSGTAVQFLAPINRFTNRGALGNSDPVIVDPIVYETPAFSTMDGLYATITAFNGAFGASDKVLGLQYTWSTLQPLLSSGGTFTLSSAGSNSLITINNPNGGQVVLSVAQNGQIKVESGAFDFLSTFSLKVTVTDVGGLTAEATILFNDVIPGAFTNAFSTAFDI